MGATHYKTRVKQIIKLYSIDNKILGRHLVEKLEIPGEKIRVAINKLRCEGVPIGSDEFGYFMARNKEELIHTKRQLKSRSNKIGKALKGLEKCFK